MPREIRLRIVEARTAADLEKRVEAIVQEIGGEILGSHYQRTARNYVAFIEYALRKTPRGIMKLPTGELLAYQSGEGFKGFKERVIDLIEEIYLQNILEEHEGNLTKAADAAGLTRYHFRVLLKKYGMYQPKKKDEKI